MVGHPAVGELTYNGFTFDGSAKITVETTIVRDEADRTPIYSRHQINVQAVVTSDAAPTGDTDEQLEDIRCKLTKDGEKLVFIDKGFGQDIKVNMGKMWDVKFGPKPLMLGWRPIGSSQTVAVNWQVVTHIPDCCGDQRFQGVMAINYEVDYKYDERGDLARTISGYIEIAMTRRGEKIPDNADLYRRQFQPPVILGFKRTQDWRLSKDKRRISFSINDTQIASPNPYPTSIVKVSGKHRVRWAYKGPATIAGFVNTLNVTAERRRGVSAAKPWAEFLKILFSRRNYQDTLGMRTMLKELEVEEDLYGWPASFRASWWTLNVLNGVAALNKIALNDITIKAGLWRPLSLDWSEWAISMGNTMYNAYGNTGIHYGAQNDVIIDLCTPAKATLKPRQTGQYPPQGDFLQSITNPKPPPAISWLKFNSALTIGKNNPVAQHGILQDPVTDNAGDNIVNPQPFSGGQGHGAFADEDDVIQEGGVPKNSVWFHGNALRFGHTIPRPKIIQVGGQKAIEKKAIFTNQVLGVFFGQPLYSASWLVQYIVKNTLGPIQL